MKGDIYSQLCHLIEGGERVALVSSASLRSSAPGEGGTRAIVTEHGEIFGSLGGGEIETRVAEEARRIIPSGKPQRLLLRVSPEEENKRGMLPGGSLKFLIEPLSEIPRLFIFGAGALSRFLAEFGRTMGFRVTVIDEERRFLDRKFFPGSELLEIPHFQNLLDHLGLTVSSYLVIATRNHQYDETVLEQLAGAGVKYLGLVHGRKKARGMFERLRARGVEEANLKKVFAPAGLGIKAFTLEEIALLIMAEIIKVRRENL
jgi:xanthine dehydrogenase accessory factor